MFAVIKTGGKQYFVKEGLKLRIEKIPGDKESIIDFAEVLMIGAEDGSEVKIGTPTVKGAKVSGKILSQGKAKKIVLIKYKAKTRYKRTKGHRQHFTEVQIDNIAL